jgi:adenosylcobinamide-GDP ribazoletransferase
VQALEVMRRSDIGPMGVATLVLVLTVQVVALSQATANGAGTEALVLAVVTGRVLVVVGCARGVPAARAEGLGAAVAGSVPRWLAAGVAVALVALAVVLGGADSDTTARQAVLAVLAGLGAGLMVLGVCLRRFGGVTGDVLGALSEVSTTAVLVMMAGSPDLGSPDWAWLPV